MGPGSAGGNDHVDLVGVVEGTTRVASVGIVGAIPCGRYLTKGTRVAGPPPVVETGTKAARNASDRAAEVAPTERRWPMHSSATQKDDAWGSYVGALSSETSAALRPASSRSPRGSTSGITPPGFVGGCRKIGSVCRV